MHHARCDHELLAKCSKTSIYGSFKLANRNILLWSFLLLPLLVASFRVWNFIITPYISLNENLPTLLYFRYYHCILCKLYAPSLHVLLIIIAVISSAIQISEYAQCKTIPFFFLSCDHMIVLWFMPVRWLVLQQRIR